MFEHLIILPEFFPKRLIDASLDNSSRPTSANYSTSSPSPVSDASTSQPTQAERSHAANEEDLEKYAKLLR